MIECPEYIGAVPTPTDWFPVEIILAVDYFVVAVLFLNDYLYIGTRRIKRLPVFGRENRMLIVDTPPPHIRTPDR
jgi:hypothetical protein